jgi:RNA-directed DNA polymerase
MDTVTQQLMDGWNTLAWKKVERTVCKRQKRLYRAQCQGKVSLVRSLQRLLRHSRSAKLWAVRRVTQENQGKKTGVSHLLHEAFLGMRSVLLLAER